VYECVDQVLDRNIAIKFLSEEFLKKNEVLQNFLHEVKLAARLNHPNLLAILDVCQDGHGCYLVMELLDSKSAGSRLKDDGPYPWPVATRMVADCCSALQVAHAAKAIHGGIKPGELLFSPTGVVKLIDFGWASLLRDEPASADSSIPQGNRLYLSPEQAAKRVVDPRSDLYSLGAVYYALLTGKPPFPVEDPQELLQAQLRTPVPDPRLIVGDIAEPCVHVLRQAMEKERSARYQDAEEMGNDLAAILASIPSRKTMTEEVDLASAPSRRRFLAGTAMGVLGLMGGEYYLLSRAGRRETPANATCVEPSEQTAAAAAAASATARPPIKVGVLHSLSGSLAVSERPLADAAQMAIEELNTRGGVLGRQLKPIIQDGKSQVTADSAFTRAAANLLEHEQVAVVFGGYGSSSRKFILPYFEKYGQLLFYPAPYEGLEESQQVIYTGSTPNQLGVPAVRWCIDVLAAKDFYLIGTDGIRAHATNEIFMESIARLGGEIVGTHYALVGESRFAAIAKRILELQPQVILSMLVGDSAASFFRALIEADITARTRPVLSFTTSENELAQLEDLSLSGHYVARTRFPEVDPGAEDGFATLFQKKYGLHRPVSDIMESAYYGVHLWAAAVEKAGSTEVNAVLQALTQHEYILGGVRISLDASNHHTWKVFQVGRIRSDNTIEVVHTAEAPLPPIPFPPPRSREDWKSFSDDLYRKWGGNWANPQKPTPLGDGLSSGGQRRQKG
jgi:urea transport system substrate-binding protein